MMRRAILLFGVATVALVLASGVALAANEVGTEGDDKKDCTKEGVTEVGTNGPETLKGTNKDDILRGLGGDDRLFSLDGCDTLRGGPGKDLVAAGRNERESEGARGDKNLFGGLGNDIVFGGLDSNNVEGGEGNDLLTDGPFRDVALDNLSGEAGKDVIFVASLRLRASAEDRVTCGKGFDRVLADTRDVVAPDCEKMVLFRGGTASEYFDLELAPIGE